jgi:uncharacterized protein YjbI with pentapeptide repeats
MATCKGRKKDGTPCRSPIVLDNGYCRAHQDQAPEAKALEEPVRWTRKRLEAAIAAHGGPEGLDLAGADLSNLDLREMDLHGTVLSPWTKESGTLIVADLRRANLRWANLQGANLVRACLRGARLREANLQEAVLGHADLRGADLVSADLQGTYLGEADLQGTYLREADLQGASLKSANLQGADMGSANLQEADLWYANLHGALLDGANLKEAVLGHADLQGAILGNVNLRGAILYGANLQEANLVDANLQGAILEGADLQGAGLGHADLQGASLRFANLREVDLLDIEPGGLLGVRLYRAKLDHTALKKQQLGPAIGDEQAGEYREARDAYLALKQNFESLGDYEAASWSYIKERQMEKACSAPWRARWFYGREQLGDTDKCKLPAYHPRVWWFFARHTSKWVRDGLVWLICEYGENPWRTVAMMVVVFAVFVGIYWATWAVVRVEDTPKAIVRVPTRNLIDLAVFGLGAFTTMDPRGLEPRAAWVQFVAGLEALLGIGLTGLLGFVLGNRIRRS